MQWGKKKCRKKKDSTFLLLSGSISQRASCSQRQLAGRPLVPQRLYGGCFSLENWAVPRRAHVILGTLVFFSHLPIFSFLLPERLLRFHLHAYGYLLSPRRKRCLAYCSSEGEETVLPFAFISSPTGVMFACACFPSAFAASFHKVAFGVFFLRVR